MGLRAYKPTSSGVRGTVVKDFAELTKWRPEESLLEKLRKTGGRSSRGCTTSRYMGGGAKKIYRIIDFKRHKDNIPAKVAAIEYDPIRSAYIALLFYTDGEKSYILAPEGLKVGMKVMSGPDADPEPGNCLPLDKMPAGSTIHNIELKPGRGGQLVRAAGGSAQLMTIEGNKAIIVLPSGEMRRVPSHCRATIGQVGNLDHQNVVIGKAGRKRWMGIRPRNRGMARNPVDHPMGGGEGRRKGRHSKGPTGVLSKGGKTRKKTKYSNKEILRGRKRGRFQP